MNELLYKPHANLDGMTQAEKIAIWEATKTANRHRNIAAGLRWDGKPRVRVLRAKINL